MIIFVFQMRMVMKKNRIWLYSLFFVVPIVVVISMVYQYYDPPELQEPYQTPSKDDTLQIAFIGDSWAYLHMHHECQIPRFLKPKLHKPVVVHTYGVSGLTSKDIYEHIYSDGRLKSFFLKRGYAFSIIAVGVNDTDLKMSVKYYQRSMDGIIQFMLANGICPIILEIPDYDIRNALRIQGIRRTIVRKISMFINNTPLDCKKQFRHALDDLLNEKEYLHNVRVVRIKSWNNDYAGDLKTLYLDDGVHLNTRGYVKLDSVLAEEIFMEYSGIGLN